jgi:hypothetical protein
MSLKCPGGERAFRRREHAGHSGQEVYPCQLCNGWHRVGKQAAPVVVGMLMVLLKLVREDGLKVQAEAAVGTMDQVVAVVADPALLLSVIKTNIKRNNNFFLIV